jgi:adenosylcobinamide-phosphate synthase
MSFIATLIALLLEQARPLARGNFVHVGLRGWVRWSSRNFDAGQSHHGWLAWGFAVGGPTLVALAVHWLLLATLGWPAAVVWSVAVLYVTLGFRQFSHHFTDIRDALDAGDEVLARELLAQWKQIDAAALPRSEIIRHVIEHSILNAHRHVFGVLTWYSVLAALGLGPTGAVLYRLSEFVARYWEHTSAKHLQPVSEALRAMASRAWELIDWFPARITAIGFAVVGSFEEAIDGWRNFEPRWPGDNDGVILAATAGAVNVRLGSSADQATPVSSTSQDADAGPLGGAGRASEGQTQRQTPEIAHLRIIVGLVWRSVVLWMLLLALLTLARLLG